MASGKQLKALFLSYATGNEEQFYATAMQLAAHEAKLGHVKLAKDLRELIDDAKQNKPNIDRSPMFASDRRREIDELLTVSFPNLKFEDMVLSSVLREKLERVWHEHVQTKKIRSYGLARRKKLLLIGPPGTGKTMTASALAGQLGLPLFEVRLDSLITKFMGETASKLRIIFDAIENTRGTYLFDEFDSIGSRRAFGNDVGEIRRILNCFLQMVEAHRSDSVLIAATNHPDLLDHALFRRFDEVIEYSNPSSQEIERLYRLKLSCFPASVVSWEKIAGESKGLSHGDIDRVCDNAVKSTLMSGRDVVTPEDILQALEEHKLTQKYPT